MLKCPTCGGHFEGVKVLWRGSGLVRKQVYVCATRRRKPGVCPNTLELPMELADDIVLDMIESEVLGTHSFGLRDVRSPTSSDYVKP